MASVQPGLLSHLPWGQLRSQDACGVAAHRSHARASNRTWEPQDPIALAGSHKWAHRKPKQRPRCRSPGLGEGGGRVPVARSHQPEQTSDDALSQPAGPW